MSAAEKDMTTKLCKKLQYHFDTKFSLKERKRKTKKENFPPNPLIKEKEKEENKDTHTQRNAIFRLWWNVVRSFGRSVCKSVRTIITTARRWRDSFAVGRR